MQNQRENLINIIARCNSKQVRKQWIHEMVSLTDIECAENQCTLCPSISLGGFLRRSDMIS